MKIELENVLPREIEKRSFELITEELGERTFPEEQEPIIKRCIHTSADFDYADNLCFSENAAIMQIISVFPKVLSKKQKKRSETEPAL